MFQKFKFKIRSTSPSIRPKNSTANRLKSFTERMEFVEIINSFTLLLDWEIEFKLDS